MLSGPIRTVCCGFLVYIKMDKWGTRVETFFIQSSSPVVYRRCTCVSPACKLFTWIKFFLLLHADCGLLLAWDSKLWLTYVTQTQVSLWWGEKDARSSPLDERLHRSWSILLLMGVAALSPGVCGWNKAQDIFSHLLIRIILAGKEELHPPLQQNSYH